MTNIDIKMILTDMDRTSDMIISPVQIGKIEEEKVAFLTQTE